MTTAGPDYECLWTDVGCTGRNNDGGVWNKSGLHQGIKGGMIKTPENDSISENHHNLPLVMMHLLLQLL